jgi:hypothetical protein
MIVTNRKPIGKKYFSVFSLVQATWDYHIRGITSKTFTGISRASLCPSDPFKVAGDSTQTGS